ncbi:hypothetical protein PC9H_006509 [Pleurotus ostreatus]|uniref:Uncharacterized protein n=1 Tax=Pleurotus ostreatus TaxID=5322 RepID=A0A8H6ZX36_PLEOS|nr:uncharacterized protein PC9H_006509 [Pleurotus ostreatus]KAF7430798.1 hypothetical protein PC9H_006509 [Pleurotus ostreatus]
MPVNFPFTFSFNVPGLTNPFVPPPQTPTRRLNTRDDERIRSRTVNTTAPLPTEDKFQRRRPIPSPSRTPLPPLSRKRAWDPAFASPSESAATLASTSGYIDTPAKYRAMAAQQTRGTISRDDFHQVEYVDEDAVAELPPAKRRRGLAGTIVSTALSAALIGTAVGLTVYRLWRDRGKEAAELPPPPYQQGGWTPVDQQQPQQSQIEEPKAIQAPPTTPRSRKTRHVAGSTHKRHRPRPRTHAQQVFAPVASTSRAQALTAPPPPEFDFTSTADDPVDEQMDWIGDKLAKLIEEGKKALGKEVVVMSDAKEDEEDDGSGAWEEEDDHLASPTRKSLSRRSSRRQLNPPTALQFTRSPPPSYSPPAIAAISSAPYHSTHFEPSSFDSSPRSLPHTPPSRPSHVRGVSVDAELGFNHRGWKEEETTWESPELRESMSRARARFARNTNGGT